MRIVLEPHEVATALRTQVREVTAARTTRDGTLEIDVTLKVGPMHVAGTAAVRDVTVEGGQLRAVADVHAGRLRAPGFALRVALARLWRPERTSLPPGAVDISVSGSTMLVAVDVRALADVLARDMGTRIVVDRVEIAGDVTIVATLAPA
ncbi:hypothetical protein [Demequina sp. NBRC 110056]|uniref:hypothetical protein n=1 Tax=Demequina sp. NBRC 110056 TaxID=1570345 RepID=UPI000A0196B2|nr:hypothetical protein [Demequina sp. NBRC 110056]